MFRLFKIVSHAKHRSARSENCDPMDHPAFSKMSLRELADIPFPRPIRAASDALERKDSTKRVQAQDPKK